MSLFVNIDMNDSVLSCWGSVLISQTPAPEKRWSPVIEIDLCARSQVVSFLNLKRMYESAVWKYIVEFCLLCNRELMCFQADPTKKAFSVMPFADVFFMSASSILSISHVFLIHFAHFFHVFALFYVLFLSLR